MQELQKFTLSNSAHNCWHWQNNEKPILFLILLIFFSHPAFLVVERSREKRKLSTLLCERASTMETRTKDKGKEKQSSWVEHALWGRCALPMSRMWRHWFIYLQKIRRSFCCMWMESWKTLLFAGVSVWNPRKCRIKFPSCSVLWMLSLYSVDLRNERVKARSIVSFFFCGVIW